MNRDDLIQELYLAGVAYDSRVLVKMPNGDYALIKEIKNENGEAVIELTLDAREELYAKEA